MRHPTPAIILAGAALLALPAAASSDAASGIPSLAAPLAACYSPTIDKYPGVPDYFSSVGPLEFSGPPSDTTTWEVRATNTSGEFNIRTIVFGADGRASLPKVGGLLIETARKVGPGETVNLEISDRQNPEAKTPLGTTKVAPLGVQIVTSPKTGPQPFRRRVPVAVSGVQFANKTLYGFLVSFKGRPGRFTKTLSRVTLGKADACGYLRKTVTLLPPKVKVPPGRFPQLYVNVGPKLDKPNAVWTTKF